MRACGRFGVCRRVLMILLRCSSNEDSSSLLNWNHPGHFFFTYVLVAAPACLTYCMHTIQKLVTIGFYVNRHTDLKARTKMAR